MFDLLSPNSNRGRVAMATVAIAAVSFIGLNSLGIAAARDPLPVGQVEVSVRPQQPLRGATKVLPDLPPWEEVVAVLSPTDWVDTQPQLVATGAQYCDHLPHQHATRQGVGVVLGRATAAVMSEDDPGAAGAAGQLAYAIYSFRPVALPDHATVGMTWFAGKAGLEAAMATRPACWIGLGNHISGGWDIFTGPSDDGVLTVPWLAPYVRPETGEVLLIVLADSAVHVYIEALELGAPETRGTGLLRESEESMDAARDDQPPRGKGGALPTYVDLSSSCAPIRSQGQCSSCTAFALGDGAYNYELGEIYGPGQSGGQYEGWDFHDPFNLVSPKWLYLNTPGGCPDDGRWLSDVCDYMVSTGCATEYSCRYQRICVADCGGSAASDARLLRLADWKWVYWWKWGTDLGPIKEQLAIHRRPVVIGTEFDETFRGWGPEGVWEYEGPSEGGHAMLVAGYSDRRQAFRVRNSWGLDWGDNGYCWIGYSTFQDPAADVMACVLWDSYDQAVRERFVH